jgi:hypothetical protein
MHLKESEKISAIKRVRQVIKNGMFLFGLKNRLARIGIEIMPYYWVQEEAEDCAAPQIKGDFSEFILRELSFEEVKFISSEIDNMQMDLLEKEFQQCPLCLGLEHNNEIAAYMFIGLNDVIFRDKLFRIKSNEAYLTSMWTFHAYRGRNIAPYLRYMGYQFLKEQGREVKYSISEYFNKSTIKFKNKLNSRHLQLYIYFNLFGKWKRHYMLRSYTDK